MLISTTIWWVMIFAMGAVAVVGVIGLKVTADDPTMGRPRLILGIMMVAGGLVAAFLYWGKHDVIICTEGAGGVETRRMVLFGTATYDNHHGGLKVGAGSGETWIVNDTSRPMRIQQVYYGIGIGGFDPIPVPAGEVVGYDDEIQHLGPGDAPPSQIQSETSIDSRQWLTWDP
jgi:hypothetical protein